MLSTFDPEFSYNLHFKQALLPKLQLAFDAFLRGYLDLLAIETKHLLNLLELHPLDLAALLVLELLVVAQFAGVEYVAAGGLDMT